MPIRPELARLLALHIGRRRAGPLFPSREKGTGLALRMSTPRQRIGQMVREVADAAGITKRIYPHLLRHTVATRLLALWARQLPTFSASSAMTTSPPPGSTPRPASAALRRKFD